MQSTFKIEKEKKLIRRWLLFFMSMLFISGLTAIPVEWELSVVTRFFPLESTMGQFLERVYSAVRETGDKHQFLFYGYDWLAFAHIVLALLFIGPYKDPVRNKWVVEFGIYSCLLIIPFALVFGYIRGLPLWWRFIDCSFGIVGLIPLTICYVRINWLETVENKNIAV
jgi:hypothetical protein